MVYLKPHLIIYGGCNADGSLKNDLWIVSLDKTPAWNLIEIKGNCPTPRMYHTMALCKHGPAKNMIFLFGGRGENKVVYNQYIIY